MQKKTIHRYEVIEQIGEGGMGVVYKARDPRIDRMVAIKTIKFGTADDAFEMEEKKKRFYREAKTSGKLFHQNIVTILDVDEFEDFSYLVMEYVEGETLSRRLRGGQALPHDTAVKIIIQVLDALGYAHGVGIIHRDIKPSNIMLLPGDHVKVADFGLAKMLSSTSANITRTGGVVGTPFYMAPEQIRGEPIDHKVDIFAAGVVLYECLTGAKPFIGDSISTIIYKILHEEPICIREFNSDLSPYLDALVQRSLAKEREKRYDSAITMMKDLQKYLHSDKEERDRTATLEHPRDPTAELLEGNATFSFNNLAVKTAVPTPTPSSSDMHTRVVESEQPPELLPKKKKKRHLFVIPVVIVALLMLMVVMGKNRRKSLVQPTSLPVVQATKPVPTSPPGGGPTPAASASVEGTPLTSSQASNELTATPTGVHEAYVRIEVEPATANIWLDGVNLGHGPIDRKVKSGSHIIAAKGTGLLAQQREVTVEGSLESPTTVTFALEVARARVAFYTEPKGAEVQIDGKGVGKTPLKSIPLPLGDHQLTLKRANYKEIREPLRITRVGDIEVKRTLTPAGMGSISINAIPWANIFIDGTSYKTTPETIENISSGIHSLKLVHPQYPEFETKIEVPLGKNGRFTYDFSTMKYGYIQVNAHPFGNVFIDGTLQGETPIRKIVSVGDHQVKVSHKGYDDKLYDVHVKAGETAKVIASFE